MTTAGTRIIALGLAGVLLTACLKDNDSVVLLSAKLTNRAEVSTAVPEEYSSFAPASGGKTVWVEGKAKNQGMEDVTGIEIIFKCTDGIDARVLVASIPSIPAGKTVSFRTKGYQSRYNVRLLDEPPEIEYTQ